MFDFLDSYDLIDKVFFYCAVFGGGIFLIRLLMQIFGGAVEGLDMDATGEGADFDGGDPGFRILTLQFVTSFFLMFGLVGLLLSREYGASEAWAIAGGLLAGIAMGAFLEWLMILALRLQHSGSLQVNDATGCSGTVYSRIAANGNGKVQVTMQGRLVELPAYSIDGAEIATGTQIEVATVKGGFLVVQPTHRNRTGETPPADSDAAPGIGPAETPAAPSD